MTLNSTHIGIRLIECWTTLQQVFHCLETLLALCRYDNVITVIKGTKHIKLFDPSSAPALRLNGGVNYVTQAGVVGYQHSGALSHFSALKFPPPTCATTGATSTALSGNSTQCVDSQGNETKATVLRDVQSVTVTLHEGEALYLPAGWAHQVTSQPASDGLHVTVNVWFGTPTDRHGDEL
jgi:hypothetical protein